MTACSGCSPTLLLSPNDSWDCLKEMRSTSQNNERYQGTVTIGAKRLNGMTSRLNCEHCFLRHFHMPAVHFCDFLFQLTAGTQWMDSGTAMTTAVWTWCLRKKCVPEEPTSFSTRGATPFLNGRPIVLSKVRSPTICTIL